MSRRILVLDTPDGALQSLASTFREAAGQHVVTQVVRDADVLVARVTRGASVDLVVVDYLLGDGRRSGREVLAALRAQSAELPIVAVADSGSVALAAEAVQAGATDFLVRRGELRARVSTLLGKVRHLLGLMEQNQLLSARNRVLQHADRRRFRIIGNSAQLLEVLDRVERVAQIPRPVLVFGERGTGKELVARAIHLASPRCDGPIVVVNCAAFPEALLESELFGHERGAYTGAEAVGHGRFELADKGTLFLDEIGNMSLAFQQKILRVVEYGTFSRVGGTQELHRDVRIVAATNIDLEARIREGQFLQDLYDRLSFEVIRVPPLRNRAGDVELLAHFFLEEFMREIPSLGRKRLAPETLRLLESYPFPGNVREMKNIIERAAYRDTTNEITPEDIGLAHERAYGEFVSNGRSFREKVDAFERQLLLDALRVSGGNQAKAARHLDMSYHQFRYYHQKHKIAG